LDYGVQGVVLFVHVELALPGGVVIVVVVIDDSEVGGSDGPMVLAMVAVVVVYSGSRVGWAYVRCRRPVLARVGLRWPA
jgi:hypothetical protein